MSPLTKEQKELVAARAMAEGMNPDEAIASVERLYDQDEADMDRTRSDAEEEDERTQQSPQPQSKIFQWHCPFITVGELRASLGFTNPFPGDKEIAADWAAKHGSNGIIQPPEIVE